MSIKGINNSTKAKIFNNDKITFDFQEFFIEEKISL